MPDLDPMQRASQLQKTAGGSWAKDANGNWTQQTAPIGPQALGADPTQAPTDARSLPKPPVGQAATQGPQALPLNAPTAAPAPAPAASAAPVAPAMPAGWKDLGNNFVLNTATGQMVDKNHPIWQQAQRAAAATAPAAAAAPSGPAGPITTQQQVGSTTATNGGQIAAGAPTTIAQSFQQALVNRLNPQPLSTSSPEVAPAIQANQLSEQRNFENNRNLLAERAAANGTNNSGGFESQLLGLAQDRAQREGQFAGNAMLQANQEKGVNDRAAIAAGAGLLGGNANLSQQQQLAELDAQLRREGLNQQGQLGNADLALRGKLGEGQLNLGLLSALMQNDQFGKSLGQNAAQFGAGLDQQGLLGLLGGL